MTFTHLLLLLAIGVTHSASLWLVTLGAKKAGAPSIALQWLPMLLGVPSAYLVFPLAIRLVMGVELAGIEERLIGASLGLPAAVGAEAMYLTLRSVWPKITEAVLARIHGDD